jgi:hypothetical protein
MTEHQRRESSTSRARTSRQQIGTRKSRGLTCGTCRFRKACSPIRIYCTAYSWSCQVRCDGTQPRCKMCELHNDDCRYDKPPPMSQLVAMAKRLQEAEQAVAELKAGADRSSSEVAPVHVDATSSAHIPLQMSPPSVPTEPSRASFNHILNLPEPTGSNENDLTNPIWDDRTSVSSRVGRSNPKDTVTPELTVDEHRSIQYYGPTSAIHEPSPAITSVESPASIPPKIDLRSSLASHAREAAIWEDFALGNASVQTGIPRHVVAKLLHIHWTWVGPMFLWIHRSAFIRTSCYYLLSGIKLRKASVMH